jgi:hypothetical protein
MAIVVECEFEMKMATREWRMWKMRRMGHLDPFYKNGSFRFHSRFYLLENERENEIENGLKMAQTWLP